MNNWHAKRFMLQCKTPRSDNFEAFLTTFERMSFSMAEYIVVHGIRIAKDFVPETFGRLTTIGPRFWLPQKNGWREQCQVYLCSCGEIKVLRSRHVVRGKTKSCGCLQRDVISEIRTTHGNTKSLNRPTEYVAWQQMQNRCRNIKYPHFHRYGGRGIRVCDRWRGDAGYENFLADMGERPSKDHSIDRIDNDGPYSPENCRWATRVEQCNNQSKNRWIEFRGETKTLPQWAKAMGALQGTIRDRLEAGWSIERALTTPVRHIKKKRKET